MLCLEEGPHHHLLDLGESGQLAEDYHAQELTFVTPALAKLEEAGTVDWLQGGSKEGRWECIISCSLS